jgi:iron only hydrogenase large subunit-like protein/uncharacterized Fe-S cluster-containing protein
VACRDFSQSFSLRKSVVCVRNCPVKAIRVHDHQARIIESQCIYCEKCILVCPQDAKEEQNMIPAIRSAMENKAQVIASLHPAYLARFGVTGINKIREAMKKLGFADVADAAEGASLMTAQYRALFPEQKELGVMISSACPVIVQLIKKHYPHLLGNLVQSASMMQFHANYLKKQYPKARIVYVSPCISVMSELREPGNEVDYVITLEELAEWLKKEGISVKEEEPERSAYRSREIALADGLTDLLGTVKGIRKLSVSGMEQCREVLKELHPEDFENCFLEMYACSGGCVAGPSFQMKKGRYLADVFAVKNAAFGKNFHEEAGDYELPEFELRRNFGYCPAQVQAEDEVSEEEIRDVLAEMGKFSPKDELNCGACGYNTCREKAIAIIQNKAEVAMCIPYMRARQESYSNKVFNAMPGLLVTVDYNLKIIQMNQAATKLFNVPKKRRLIGKPVSEIMDDYSLASILAFDRNLMQDEIYLEDQKCYLDRVMTNDKENKMILCIMKDITKERKHKDQIYHAQVEAARMADKLVEEQLKIVQQIAGLLGETAADTKVAVEKLKNTILLESEEPNEKK